MNDSQKEDNPPFKQFQESKEIDFLKTTMSACQKRIEELPVKDNPEARRLKAQIATANIKLSALLSGRKVKEALKKKQITGKMEKDLFYKPKLHEKI